MLLSENCHKDCHYHSIIAPEAQESDTDVDGEK